jgi:hypothetical protein
VIRDAVPHRFIGFRGHLAGFHLSPERRFQFLRQEIFASGLVCWLTSAVLMTLAWTLAMVRSRTLRDWRIRTRPL